MVNTLNFRRSAPDSVQLPVRSPLRRMPSFLRPATNEPPRHRLRRRPPHRIASQENCEPERFGRRELGSRVVKCHSGKVRNICRDNPGFLVKLADCRVVRRLVLLAPATRKCQPALRRFTPAFDQQERPVTNTDGRNTIDSCRKGNLVHTSGVSGGGEFDKGNDYLTRHRKCG